MKRWIWKCPVKWAYLSINICRQSFSLFCQFLDKMKNSSLLPRSRYSFWFTENKLISVFHLYIKLYFSFIYCCSRLWKQQKTKRITCQDRGVHSGHCSWGNASDGWTRGMSKKCSAKKFSNINFWQWVLNQKKSTLLHTQFFSLGREWEHGLYMRLHRCIA